ncbi:MAG: toll/interleukin-1 receptor domain-containing protein, partial [bacterium]|nr:toll/interleukin-1 receptor domain-containing protein [bacterium]
MPRKVFICYSSKDQTLFNEFRTHLAPFEQQGLLLSWSDQEIRPSEPWDRRIHQAIDNADAAVMLVSPDMLASDYVVEEEIPRLIEAAEAGRLHLMSLFLRPCHPDVRSFDVLDAETGERGIRITKYQGLNQPSNPVHGRPKAVRDRLLAECAGKLGKALEELPVARERRRTTLLRELSVELR